MQKYYDLEYDKIVTDKEIREKYNRFIDYIWFSKSYEEFRNDNYRLITDRNKDIFMYLSREGGVM